MKVHTVLAIMRKDITDAIRNQFILAFLALPVVVALVFRLIFPTDSQEITVVAHDPDHSRLVMALEEMPEIRLLKVDSDAQLMESMRANGAAGGLAIPPGFDASVAADEQPELTAYLNYRQAEGKRNDFQRLIQQQVTALMPPPASVAWVDLDAPSGSQAYSFSIEDFVLILTLVLSVVAVSMMIIPLLLVEEKERHTLSFLQVSPASTTDIVVGKSLVGFTYNLAITAIVVSLNYGWKGNWDITLLALLLGSLFAVPVGLLLGALFNNAIQLNTWGTVPVMILLVPSFIPGGQALSPILRTVLQLIPTYYLVDTLNLSLAGEASIAKVWGNLAMLLGSTVITFTVAVLALRQERNH